VTRYYPKQIGDGDLLIRIVRIICRGTFGKSMIDLCCNHATCSSRIGFSKRRYVDVKEKILDDPQEQEFFLQQNALNVDGLYDVALCFDGIEHLTKEDGFQLVKVMQKVAPVRIIFTPLGDLAVGDFTHSVDDHKSGWMPDDFPGFGCLVFPNWHPTLNAGAFFAFQCPGLDQEFERVKLELSNPFL
jgi:hypothetical protein